jgi:hypothetical protein
MAASDLAGTTTTTTQSVTGSTCPVCLTASGSVCNYHGGSLVDSCSMGCPGRPPAGCECDQPGPARADGLLTVVDADGVVVGGIAGWPQQIDSQSACVAVSFTLLHCIHFFMQIHS